MGNPIFRFTLSHVAQANQPIAIPALSLWSTATGPDTEWSPGSVPSITLAGAFPTVAESEFYWVDYGFTAGNEYTLTVNYTKFYNFGTSNPRLFELHILDNAFNTIFSESGTTPTSPGGSGSVTISFTATSLCTKIGLKVFDGSNVTITVQSVSSTETNPNDEDSSLVITEPAGWIDAKLKLERHEEFHSLLEYFTGSFLYYGTNGVDNGGIVYILDLERRFGCDVDILETIEISFDNGGGYELVYEGLLDLEALNQLWNNQLQVPTITDNFWSSFINRKATPVDLQASTDIDLKAIATLVDPVNINLSSQKLRAITRGVFDTFVSYKDFGGYVLATDYLQMSWDSFTYDEIEERFTQPSAINPERPFGQFTMKYAGSYSFRFRLYFTRAAFIAGGIPPLFTFDSYENLAGLLEVHFLINNQTFPVIFTRTDLVTSGGDGYSMYEFSLTNYTLNAGDIITVYGKPVAPVNALFPILLGNDLTGVHVPIEDHDDAGTTVPDFPNGYTDDNYLEVTADTTFPESQEAGFLIHDAAAAIIKSYGLGFSNPFYSELLGSGLTNARQYELDGCAWKYLVLKGLQLRGYTLSEKPFFLSFDQWWKGINPILNLCLFPHFIAGNTVSPITSSVQVLPDWVNAGGPFPGVSWNYFVFGYPFVSVNGNGGTEGYTCGLWTTVGGQSYVLTTVVEIFESGTNPVNMTFRWAILDAGFNELVTQEFTYNDEGFKHEVFNITPPSNGTYLAVRIINDTVSDTKSLVIRVAQGETTEQMLVNPEFDGSSPWTNVGAGTSWTFASGRAAVSLVSGSSKELTQVFAGGIGDHHFIAEYLAENVGGGEQIDITINFLDSLDNVIATKTESAFTNNTKAWNHEFTSVVEIVKLQVIITVISGTNIDFSTPYAAIFLVVPTPDIVTEDEQVLRVEERAHVYDDIPVVNIDNVLQISREYDTDLIYKKIEVGYANWKSEDISGIDDPQAVHTYAARFKKMGTELSLKSEFIAASLAIETTRRQTIEKSKDYKFDDNTFIIAINPDNVSPDSYVPELDENFDDIQNLLNSETRYNTRITPPRNLLRHANVIFGCLQSYLNSFLKFVGGEGNYDMTSKMTTSLGTPGSDCLNESFDGNTLSEKQDIQVTDEYIHLPLLYSIEINMSWETYNSIRTNRKKAIGISQTESDHQPFFIKSLEYEPSKSRASIKAWPKTFFEILVPDFLPPVVPQPVFPDCILLNEDGAPILNEDGSFIYIEDCVSGDIPANALIDRNGNPILDRNGNYILIR
jgi:hypothetical protein